MIKTRITDSGTGQQARVLPEGELLVSTHTSPPLLPQKSKLFSQHLTDDGLSDGDEDMRVDGSVKPVYFWITADEDSDRYITVVNFVIADEGAKFSEFGHITALTNGCQFYYERDNEIVYIGNDLKTNWDFVRVTLSKTPESEMKVQKDIEGKVDAYVPCFNLSIMLPPFGVKLDKGSSQRLIVKVRDDIQAIDSFNGIAYGFDRFE